ncbi:hypothetical protein DAPPUDRAFT_306037 [Daphnia pulex]|uniref:Uncharacterized protein n=1 Tax=Daphnia pulex TaxID=6669 RepID=E9GU83_DAPPU|nr:hypothetical protein DAPPUDRAFT_306037 [Daphnia pulex]|eukprot:EFX76990.1 hypothetical protein DAPPUDRAFT_306037 [Daphnia pulex]
MVATALVFKVWVLSGLVCLSQLTSTCASAPSSTSDLQSTNFNGTQGLVDGGKVTKSMSESNKNNSVTVMKTWRSRFERMTQTSRKLNAKSLVSPQLTLDKIYLFIDTVNNILNGNTSDTKFNRMVKTWGVLYTSSGAQALNNFLNMWVSLWTVIDAVANIFRAYETRFLNTFNENQPPEPNPLEDLQASLDDANNNIAAVSGLFQTLARMGEVDDTEMFDDGQAQILKRTLPQDPLQEEDDDTENNRAAAHYERSDRERKDPVYSKGQEVNILASQRSQLETNRHSFSPAKFGSDSANNRQNLLYSITERNAHNLNPVSDSLQIQRFSVKSDPDNRINRRQTLVHESTPKSTSTHPSNLELHRAAHSPTRSKRSYLEYDFGIDRFVYVMRKMNNVLNSNTNNRQLNRFTSSFNNLFASNGLVAFNTFYTLLASFWTVVDAVTNIFRFNEARIRDGIQRNQDQNKPDPLADLQAELDDTNANLEEVAELVTTLDQAAARLETVTGDEFDRSGVKNKKKKKKSKKSKKHNSRRRKPSLQTTPQPTRYPYPYPVTHSYSVTRDNSFSTHPPIQPASSDRWKPIYSNWSPVIPQSSAESNRNIYHYPAVSYASQISNSQNNNPLPSSTTYSYFSPANIAVGRTNPQPPSIAENRNAMNYDNRMSNSQQQSSPEINRHAYPASNNDHAKYNSWVGLHRSTASGQRYRKASAIVQPRRK